MNLLKPRAAYGPFEYPKAYEYWERQQQSHWLFSEISMASDINDWKLNLTEAEKSVVGHTLKGFTQSEVFIQEYWTTLVSKWFKKPEIQMMAATFGAFESIHAVSYAYLNQSLGLEDFEAFLHEPTAKAKIDRLITTKGKSVEEIARSLAIFSAFNEGVNLFSSFAILLNFSRFNKMKGLGQIIAFSIKDECYSADTEILTPTGFKKFSDLTTADKVGQFDPKTQEISFVVPERILKQKHIGKMIHFKGESANKVDLLVTPGHQMLVKWLNKPTDWTFQSAKELKTNSPHKAMPLSGFKQTGRSSLTPHERFLIALQADGSLSDRYTGERVGTRPAIFTFAKQRKIDRFREILNDTKYSFKEGTVKANGNKKAQVKFSVDVPINLGVYKFFNEWVNLVDVSTNWAVQFLEELSCWDGHIPANCKYVYYSSTISSNVDIVQAVAAIAGKWVTRTIQKDHRSETFSDVHRAYIHNQQVKRLGKIEKTEVDYDDFVYCVTVPTSAVVVRRNGAVSIAGNCLHSDAGCWLFRTLIAEHPEIWTDTLKKEIYEAARLTIELEDAFIDRAYSMGELEGLSSKDLKNFIRHRCNTKLTDLGLKSNWKNIDKEALERMSWFDVLSAGTSHGDFFASRVDSYSRGVTDFSKVWE